MRLEDWDIRPESVLDITPDEADVLEHECRDYDEYLKKQDDRRWGAGYRRYLSTSDEPKRVA